MGLFDWLRLPDHDTLPEFPKTDANGQPPNEIGWQTKRIGYPAMRTFRIRDGRLERREVEREEVGEREVVMNGDELTLPQYEIVNEWWADHNHHGTFEFHHSDGEHYWSYEARFTRGELDEIVHLETTELSGSTIADPAELSAGEEETDHGA